MMSIRPHAKVVFKGLGHEMNIFAKVLKIKSILHAPLILNFSGSLFLGRNINIKIFLASMKHLLIIF